MTSQSSISVSSYSSELARILQNLRASGLPWPTLRSIASDTSLDIGKGWDQLLHSVKQTKHLTKTETLTLEKLRKIHEGHIFYNNKAIRIYTVPDPIQLENEITKLLSKTPQTKQTKSIEKIILSTSPLMAKPPQLDTITEDEKSFIFSFHCVRELTERSELSIPPNLNAQAHPFLKQLQGFTEIIRIRKICKPFLDFVRVDKDFRYIELLVDRGHDLRNNDLNLALYHLYRAFNEYAKKNNLSFALSDTGKNLFGNVKKLYNEPLGRITEIGFETAQGTIHREKSRRKLKDLRKTTYHLNGSKSTPITPFSIGKAFSMNGFNTQYETEVLLLTSSRILSQPIQYIGEAFIKGALRLEDYSSLIGEFK